MCRLIWLLRFLYIVWQKVDFGNTKLSANSENETLANVYKLEQNLNKT